MLKSAGDGAFLFDGSESIAGRYGEVLQALAHDRLEKLACAVTADRIGIEDRDRSERIGRACKIGPRSRRISITASSWSCGTAKGALLIVAMR